jgi:hypothetical protein
VAQVGLDHPLRQGRLGQITVSRVALGAYRTTYPSKVAVPVGAKAIPRLLAASAALRFLEQVLAVAEVQKTPQT